MSLSNLAANGSEVYIVATPIGNPEDISLRALRVLKEADLVIGEERKIVSRFLRSLDLHKEVILINEHTEISEIKELVIQLLSTPKKVAFLSDCGTPGFEDPGVDFVSICREYNIKVVPVPGVSSLMTLIMVSGIPMKKFYYAGFLSAKREIRQDELKRLAIKYPKESLVLLDTPYRLQALLEDIKMFFSPDREIILGYKLTMPEEKVITFRIKEYQQAIKDLPKGEFVIIIK